jgi:DNA-binding MarR family transcriptional regulator
MSNHSIGYLLHHISAVLARHSDQILQEQLGVGFSQFKILLILQQKSGVQQKQIATALGQTEASISRQIKLLQDGSLLTSTVHPSNRRRHIIRLTPKGLKVIDRAMQILNGYHAPVFARLDEKQQARLAEMLAEIHKTLCSSEHDL